MIVTNSEGLTSKEAEKALRPYARNKGEPHNPKDAAREAVAFLESRPGFLEKVGDLLDERQS